MEQLLKLKKTRQIALGGKVAYIYLPECLAGKDVTGIVIDSDEQIEENPRYYKVLPQETRGQ